jgi:hypothetical protein
MYAWMYVHAYVHGCLAGKGAWSDVGPLDGEVVAWVGLLDGGWMLSVVGITR